MDRSQLPFKPVFVGGAPRSGTTLLHALICTSREVNAYVGECSYLTHLTWAFVRGMEQFDIHTRFHFRDRGAFEAYHADLMATVLGHYWHSLGDPATLALKDPNFTVLFPVVVRWFPQARFVIATRDPRDVVASRIQVQQRATSGAVDRGYILSFADEYNAIYGTLLQSRAGFGDRLLFVSYEDLVNGGEIDAIARFLGLSDLDPAAVWRRSVVPKDAYATSPWSTPLYHAPMSADSVGNFRNVLDEAAAAEVMQRCGPIFAQLRPAAQA